MNTRFLGVVCLLSLLIVSAFGKITGFDGHVNMIYSKIGFNYLPKWFSQLTIVVVIAMLFIGSALLLVTSFTDTMKKYETLNKISVCGFILFLVLATLYFHNIIVNPSEKYNFLKNLSIIGGLILLFESIDKGN